jgi:transposase
VALFGAAEGGEQARVSRKLRDRIEVLPKAVRDIAWKGQLRMCQRYRHLMAAGKPKMVATTAIAREMVGFIWAIARAVTPAPGGAVRIHG